MFIQPVLCVFVGRVTRFKIQKDPEERLPLWKSPTNATGQLNLMAIEVIPEASCRNSMQANSGQRHPLQLPSQATLYSLRISVQEASCFEPSSIQRRQRRSCFQARWAEPWPQNWARVAQIARCDAPPEGLPTGRVCESKQAAYVPEDVNCENVEGLHLWRTSNCRRQERVQKLSVCFLASKMVLSHWQHRTALT